MPAADAASWPADRPPSLVGRCNAAAVAQVVASGAAVGAADAGVIGARPSCARGRRGFAVCVAVHGGSGDVPKPVAGQHDGAAVPRRRPGEGRLDAGVWRLRTAPRAVGGPGRRCGRAHRAGCRRGRCRCGGRPRRRATAGGRDRAVLRQPVAPTCGSHTAARTVSSEGSPGSRRPVRTRAPSVPPGAGIAEGSRGPARRSPGEGPDRRGAGAGVLRDAGRHGGGQRCCPGHLPWGRCARGGQPRDAVLGLHGHASCDA